MTSAQYGGIGVLDNERTGFGEFVAIGPTPQEREQIGLSTSDEGVVGRHFADPRPLQMSGPEMIRSRKDELPFSHPSITSFLSVPIKVRDEVYGSFFLTDKIGCPHFTSDDQSLVEALAFAVGIAIENSRLRALVAAGGLAIERDQSAKDLHDTTIQHLFGLGLKLRSMVGGPTPPEISEGLSTALVHIDDIINQVRSTIFEGDPADLPSDHNA